MTTKLTEEDIRPKALMQGQKIAALTDVGRLLTRCSEFVEVDCPACGAQHRTAQYSKNGLRYVRCVDCHTLYVSPRPTAEVLAWFYRDSPNYAYWNDHIFPASEASRRTRIFVPRVDRLLDICSRYQTQTDSLLEVGAGFGTFCSELMSRKVFKRVVGVEPTPGLANSCRERGIEIIEKPIEDIALSQTELFDVVASFEVIEHLFSPLDFAHQMVRLLRPGGLLLLTCPNGQGFDIETLGPTSDTVDHEHLNYFNATSLERMLQRVGLDVLESFTPGLLDAELVRNKVLEGAFDLNDAPFLKRVLIDKWELHGQAFQNFLITQGLSSNLWILARKPL